MPQRQFKLVVALSVLLLLGGSGFGQDSQPHIVLVVGTTHYSPELSMPLVAKELERFGFRTTIVMGEGDPEKKIVEVLPGIESLDNADAAIFFMRFLKLPDNEWKHVEEYFKSGKPIIALRTTTHSFKYDKAHPRFTWNDDFGRRVMGTPYIVHQSGTTNVKIVPKHKSHPIMTNIGEMEWVSEGTLYLTRLESGCIPLVTGTGKGKARLLEKSFGPVSVNESESDIVAWAWQNEWGAKIFGTSFGHPADFANPDFTRMLVNSVHWAVDKPLPESTQEVSTWKIERVDKKKK